MTDNDLRLRELVEANPLAQAEASRIEEAMDLVQQLRDFGLPEKQYELATPFGDRNWLRTMRVSAGRG
jgi:hypothetical protein